MMNKMRVDYGEAKIILARSFAKKAEIVGSPEYLELQECREKHPPQRLPRASRSSIWEEYCTGTLQGKGFRCSNKAQKDLLCTVYHHMNIALAFCCRACGDSI